MIACENDDFSVRGERQGREGGEARIFLFDRQEGISRKIGHGTITDQAQICVYDAPHLYMRRG